MEDAERPRSGLHGAWAVVALKGCRICIELCCRGRRNSSLATGVDTCRGHGGHAVSAVMARRPRTISLRRFRGMPILRAASTCVSAAGLRNSSSRISPGRTCTRGRLGSLVIVFTAHLVTVGAHELERQAELVIDPDARTNQWTGLTGSAPGDGQCTVPALRAASTRLAKSGCRKRMRNLRHSYPSSFSSTSSHVASGVSRAPPACAASAGPSAIIT